MSKKIHLICNAHLDPVWLWRRSEGIAEALSTFRIAADFCERYDNFVFNHNESVLYEWVMENEPELFERIQKLVKAGKWRIMGGWYLQPDVLMPSGESIIRQIRTGKEFFEKYFGQFPETAINFDSFGHSKGLVQILNGCGYKNYAYLRPRDVECRPFIWKGVNDSSVNAYKMYEWYNTPKGEALERIENYLKDFPDRKVNAVSWGIGNHGGGPSEKDLNDINNFIGEHMDIDFAHSDFDSYFAELDKSELEEVNTSLTHCMVGCYTSMARVKQGHRKLENSISMAEKMLCLSGVSFDEDEFKKAEKALLFTEFHDVLPGSAIKKVEDDSLRLVGYGEEIADRAISKSFFKLCAGQKKANDGEIPVMIFNPHPYPVEGDFEVEFQLAEQNHPSNGIYDIKVRTEDGDYVPCQCEQEDSAHGMDWRKKVVFHAVAKAMSITRFDCELELRNDFEKIKQYTEDGKYIVLGNGDVLVKINKETGLIDEYKVDGFDVLEKDGIRIKAFYDDEDPWGMDVDSFQNLAGEFELLSPDKAIEISNGAFKDGAVAVVENGDCRCKVQALFGYKKSYAIVTYTVSKNSKHIDIDVKMLTNDTNTMFKLCFKTTMGNEAKAYAQTMFATEETRKDGAEIVFQKWCGLDDGNNRIAVINGGSYGGSIVDNEIQISLLRTAVYSAHPVEGVDLAMKDRMYEHIDMGERDFNFRLCANTDYIDYESEIFNQKPYVLSFFPSGNGVAVNEKFEISNKHIILSSFAKTQKGRLIRLYNSSDDEQKCSVCIGNICNSETFKPFEVKTFTVSDGSITKTNMLQE